MPSVKFIEHNGKEHVVEGDNGDSLMVIATSNLVQVSTPIAAVSVPARPVMYWLMMLG